MRAEHRNFQEHRRHDHQIRRAEDLGQADGQHRSGERARSAARGDESEQALTLLGAEKICHVRPEDRDREQHEHADPDEEHARHDFALDAERQQQPENRQIGDKKMVDDRDEAPPRQARHQRAVDRHRGEHGEEGRGEQPLQVAHPARHAHLVAQRPQHVIAGEQAEEIGERPAQRPALAWAHRATKV